ncbi:MAG TPA: PilN domain-containing protein [Patescibacteria group bacterium]|jgi:type IV pilus assembly protein PilN|nr:PilN domain-containing protein [Patescibacteria group bacterium]
MIKVNLLTGAKRESVRKQPALKVEGGGGSQNILLVVILGLCLAFAGWRYYSLSAEGVRLDQDLDTAHEQLKKVEDDRKAIEVLKVKKAAFQKQIDIITTLKNNQQVPVRLLDEVSRNLPDFLWLVSMQETGNQLTFSGKATTPNAYANFYNNLDASPFFQEVGKISYTADRDNVTFSLSAKFVPGGKQTKPPAAGQQGE